MVLVDGDHVEAELLGVDQLLDVGLVLVGALDRVVERIRQHHPAGAMLPALDHVERAVGHQMEEGELHQRVPAISCMISLRGPLRLLDDDAVSAIRDDLDAARRDALAPARGIGGSETACRSGPRAPASDADAMQPAFERRIEPARVPAEFRRSEAVGQHQVGLLVGHRHGEQAVGDRLVVVEVAHRLLGVPDEIVAAVDALHAHARGREQREACKPRAVSHRDLSRGPAAERQADEMHAIGAEAVEEIEVVHREIGNVANPGRIVRGAEAGMFRDDHLELLRKDIEHRQPDRQAVGAVQKDQRRA